MRLIRYATLVGCVLAILGTPAFAASPPESVPRRLLRTIQLGFPQGIALDEIRQLALRSSTDYNTVLLARSALLVLGAEPARAMPYEELLDGVLNQLLRETHAFQPPSGLPDFRGKETVLAMTYAMVMSGNQERAVTLLERHLATGGKYKHAIVVQALRNIGTPRAVGLIQKYAETGENRNLADATLADQNVPFLFEIYQRWNVVPPAQRTRDSLLGLVHGGCDERAGMAAYWLGFFAPHADAVREKAEIDVLRAMARGKACPWIERMIAWRSLALRSGETVERWVTYARETDNVWERHQIVVDAFARQGRRFAPAALKLLTTEPAQYVQWELMQGNLVTRRSRPYRTYWDLWIPVNLLVVLDDADADGRLTMDPTEVDTLLTWLESGGRPRDVWVTNHMLYNLGGVVAGDHARRYLKIFDSAPKRGERLWILTNLREPATLPLLRYWSTQPAPKDQASQLKTTIDQIAEKVSQTSSPALCCRPDESCLIEQLGGNEAPWSVAIASEEEVRQWLASPLQATPTRDVTITYTDSLRRAATVRRASDAEQRWEFLYDCWRRVDTK